MCPIRKSKMSEVKMGENLMNLGKETIVQEKRAVEIEDVETRSPVMGEMPGWGGVSMQPGSGAIGKEGTSGKAHEYTVIPVVVGELVGNTSRLTTHRHDKK